MYVYIYIKRKGEIFVNVGVSLDAERAHRRAGSGIPQGEKKICIFICI